MSGGAVAQRSDADRFGVFDCRAVEQRGAFAKGALGVQAADVAEQPGDGEGDHGRDESVSHFGPADADQNDSEGDDGDESQVVEKCQQVGFDERSLMMNGPEVID